VPKTVAVVAIAANAATTPIAQRRGRMRCLIVVFSSLS
jgi:hypothetical protein